MERKEEKKTKVIEDACRWLTGRVKEECIRIYRKRTEKEQEKKNSDEATSFKCSVC